MFKGVLSFVVLATTFISFVANESITIKGSDTMVILAQRRAEVYMKKKKNVVIQVTGGGSGTGVSALINGTTDICNSSRSMKKEEKISLKEKYGSPGVGIKVAIDGLSVYVNKNNPINELSLQQIKDIHVGMIFQKSNPFLKSIYDNGAYGPRIQGIRDKKTLDEIVESSLRRAALWDEVKDELKKSALAISGGQQQRLCVARALAVNPEILLMNEPASALEPLSTIKIEDLIFELKENYPIVIVAHNMQQATRVSDYTAFFYMGQLVEFGDTPTIFTAPKKNKPKII